MNNKIVLNFNKHCEIVLLGLFVLDMIQDYRYGLQAGTM